MHLSKMKNWSGLFILSLASTVPAVYSEETKKGSCKMVVSSSIKGGKEKTNISIKGEKMLLHVALDKEDESKITHISIPFSISFSKQFTQGKSFKEHYEKITSLSFDEAIDFIDGVVKDVCIKGENDDFCGKLGKVSDLFDGGKNLLGLTFKWPLEVKKDGEKGNVVEGCINAGNILKMINKGGASILNAGKAVNLFSLRYTHELKEKLPLDGKLSVALSISQGNFEESLPLLSYLEGLKMAFKPEKDAKSTIKEISLTYVRMNDIKNRDLELAQPSRISFSLKKEIKEDMSLGFSMSHKLCDDASAYSTSFLKGTSQIGCKVEKKKLGGDEGTNGFVQVGLKHYKKNLFSGIKDSTSPIFSVGIKRTISFSPKEEKEEEAIVAKDSITIGEADKKSA